ncbi:metallophosphoesterase [Candidatus Pacearchaeota archaeon]|nr:metallophosphoesterase [Candidatus Pacearchaeota archaeon]
MNETVYGIISDVHEHPEFVPFAVHVLKQLGAQKLIVNGDIGGRYGSLRDSQDFTAQILAPLVESGLETFVQPGSHETLDVFEPVVNYFTERHPQLHSALEHPFSEQNGHDLIFLPGSDFTCGGQYLLCASSDKNELPSGKYAITIHNEFIPLKERKQIELLANLDKIAGVVYVINMSDLERLVKRPEQTLVVCHVPPKFGNTSVGIDMAHFGVTNETFDICVGVDLDGKKRYVIHKGPIEAFRAKCQKLGIQEIINRQVVYDGSIFPQREAESWIAYGAPITLKIENRGNVDLRRLYDELGIRKAVSGHFHESVHRAHDASCKQVPEGAFTQELFWNASYLDEMKVGLLKTRDANAAYRNILLREHLRFDSP